jgi:Transposase DDE domain group 1
MTQCNPDALLFQELGSRDVVARFDGGKVTSDAGGLLLREVEAKFNFIARFAHCFTDHRDPELVEHTLPELLKQRIFGLCLGYEDLNDHEQLRHDPLLAVLVGKKDPAGDGRVRDRDRGKALAGKSTLNRLELTPVRAHAGSRYKKVVAHLDAIQAFLVEAFVGQYLLAPGRIVLDVDATDDPLHGHQLGRFFHGYYDCYCYLPLYIFCGDHPLLALLRPSDIDPSTGLLKHLSRIVGRLRQQWPNVAIVVRGDSGFCREHLMRWCEANGVDYLFGLAKNRRLLRILGREMHQAQEQFARAQQPSRVFKDFTYRTHKTWSRERRVVGKAEHLARGANPRFVVTSLSAEAVAAQALYEQEYCGRGDMENRIKEQQLMLFACRASCATMRANQIRLALSTVAYVVLRALRAYGLAQTELAQAQCDTIRVKLLKIGAVIRVTVRRVSVSLSESYPFREAFVRVYRNLRRLVAPPAVVPAVVVAPSG